MICPFSGKLCRDCPVYRGRHYYLCFNTRYRGYIQGEGDQQRGRSDKVRLEKIPLLRPPKAVDPFEPILQEWRKLAKGGQE